MKTAIYGGAFNPIHNGHINLASWFMKNIPLDRVIFVPTATPPHKSANHLASKEDRINMLTLAVGDTTGFEISDIEFNRDGKSYTYDTICEMKKLYPNDELYLIVGADQFMSFSYWYKADEILSMVTLLAGARNSMKERDRLFSAKGDMEVFENKNIIIANSPVVKISSDEIRQKIRNKENVDEYLPKCVCEYIKSRGLYNE